MALVIGTNSWASVAEADIFLADRIDAEAWFLFAESGASGVRTKESLLVSAFYWLRGSPQLSLPSSSTDADVKNAQIEAAWFLQEYYEEMKDRRAALATGVETLRMSRRTESLSIRNLGIPNYILGMLASYQASNVTVTLKGEYDG